MRCECCDVVLTDFEATRKSKLSGEYLNTCNKCLKDLGIHTIDRKDLERGFSKINEDPSYDEDFCVSDCNKDDNEDDYDVED